MSYETHVTMIINCLTVSVYAYMVLVLVDMSLFMVIFSAKSIPPNDVLSMLFNIWFGVITISLVAATQNLFLALFFSDVLKARMNQPLSSTTTIMPDGSAVKRCVYKNQDQDSGIFYLLSALRQEPAQSDSAAAAAAAATASAAESTANSSPAQSESPAQCPGTPDSQADTEPEPHAELAKIAKEAMAVK